MANTKAVKTVKKKKRRLTLAEKVVSIISIIIIIGSIGAVAYVYVMNSKLFTIKDPMGGEISSKLTAPKEQQLKSTNILLCGIDYLEGSTRAKLTDVIMIANVDYVNKRVNVLQLPRDSFIGDIYGTGKINAVYGSTTDGGIAGLAQVISDMLMIPIDNYLTLNMTGFRKLVNAVGGVEVDSPVSFYLEGVTIKKGKQVLDGKTADRFVRNRKTYPTGDLMRNQMQQLFLKALMEKMFTLSFKDISRLAPTILKYVSTDMTLNQLLDLYKEVSKMGKQAVDFHSPDVSFAKRNGQSVVSLHAKPLADYLNKYFRAHTPSYEWDELGIVELVTDYPYTPPVEIDESESKTTKNSTSEYVKDEDLE